MQRVHRRLVTRQAGFTLLELLTVLLVIGVLAAVVVLSYTGATETRTLVSHAERFMLATELARQKSTLGNEIWGIRVGTNSYDFLRRMDDGEWHEILESPFEFRSLGADYELRHRDLGNTKKSNTNPLNATLPDILIFPSGEVSPFQVELVNRLNRVTRYVISDGIGRAVIANVPYQPITMTNEG